MKKSILEEIFVEFQRGMWQLLGKAPGIFRVCLIVIFFALFFFPGLVNGFGSKKAKRVAVARLTAALIVSLGMILGLFYGWELPTTTVSSPAPTQTPTPTLTPTPTPSQSEIDRFLERGTYSKEYEVLSVYTNTVPSFWGLTEGTVFLAEETLVKAELKLSQLDALPAGEGTLEIDTLRNGYNVFSVSMPMGESLYTYGAFEVPKETISWKEFEKKLQSGVSRAIWSNHMGLANSRAYKLAILEGKRRTKKSLLQDMLEEEPFTEYDNIFVDGVQFKKSGKMLEVKQADIEALFDFGIDPEIDPPSDEEKISLYFEGGSGYEEKSSIFAGIKKYREERGLDPVTGFS